MKPIAAMMALTAVLAGCQFLPWSGGGGSATATNLATVSGHVVAGPVCPVERVPPDPGCAPRPVAGAVLDITDAHGSRAARVVSDTSGGFALELPPGDYTLSGEPVSGLMGVPAAMTFSVRVGSPVDLTVEYDTGIR